MTERFLLYIDILGFAEMTSRDPRKVARIYAILDSLNAHKHDAFKTIVFSDTVLVYNDSPAVKEEDKNYLVWYLIEFAEDLHHRLTGQDVFFRAILTKGDFSHYSLKHIQCFFGQALVNAYLAEKEIPSIGLFIDDACNKHNQYFKTSPFNDKLHFVYLNRHLEYLDRFTGASYPQNTPFLEDEAPFVPWQVRFLKDVYFLMRSHPVPAVRTKFLTAWDFHSRHHPALTQALVAGNFSLQSISGRPAWISESRTMEKGHQVLQEDREWHAAFHPNYL